MDEKMKYRDDKSDECWKMKIPIILLSLYLLIGAVQASPNAILTESQLSDILNYSDRPAKDKVRDIDRRPIKIMAFSGVAKGDKILDLYAGGGWYSELFSKAVGLHGTVYAHNDSLTWRFGKKEIVERTEANRLPNVVRLDKVAIAEIEIPDKSLDIAFMAINYHDLFDLPPRYRTPS